MWIVKVPDKVKKAKSALPRNVQASFDVLVKEIEAIGPVRGNWPNYGKLGNGRHHCHLKKGHPTYVAVWREVAGSIQLVEVKYVGTHENAPY